MPKLLSWARRRLQALAPTKHRPDAASAAILPPAATTLVAIAKTEGRYLPEWIAFHLSIGIDRILVYDNDSSDDGAAIVRALEGRFPVHGVSWPSGEHESPQLAAYADALKRAARSEWVLFIDIDEFAVPFGYSDWPAFLATLPPDVSCVGLNTRVFGSSGRVADDYDLVLKTFTRCSAPGFAFNRHIKTLARPGDVAEMFIHHAVLRSGRAVDSALADLVLPLPGRTAMPVFDGIQINHYQSKTYDEFVRRRGKGDANVNPAHAAKMARRATREGFDYIDRNDVEDRSLAPFLAAFERQYAEVRAVLDR
ncbi:glycosyltransferase family 2 protein [Methylorubrum sp. SB2]|uniref:glycosyltransferase family 2 protein n=1 Tax=Methylorubrum subtropicum TaxID=3138812 RepID=UPI00313C0CA4